MTAPARGAVLVTGASTGIGAATARALAGAGYHVYAGMRKPESTGARGSPRLEPVALDVTSVASVRAAAARLSCAPGGDGRLVALVNNAGILVSGPLEHVPLGAMRAQLDVNVIGTLAVIQAFLPLLRRARGRIVNVGSTSGRIAGPFIGPYCASKFALEAMSRTLRAELRPAGVSVSVVEPGIVRTGLWEKVRAGEAALAGALELASDDPYAVAFGRRQEQLAAFASRGAPPEDVAAVIVAALRSPRPKFRYVVGIATRARAAAQRALPERVEDWLRARRSSAPGVRQAAAAPRRPPSSPNSR
jgi:NAD(P)-dependent dehydrogenase (short-subunit alcohol dehydrogenase family)